jgi:hypothetical protein
MSYPAFNCSLFHFQSLSEEICTHGVCLGGIPKDCLHLDDEMNCLVFGAVVLMVFIRSFVPISSALLHAKASHTGGGGGGGGGGV